MTFEQANENLSEMRRVTSKRSRIKLIELALRIGNLSDDARKAYQSQLAADK